MVLDHACGAGMNLLLADVVVQRELSLEARSNPVLWAACVGGALVEQELFTLAEQAGLQQGQGHYSNTV